MKFLMPVFKKDLSHLRLLLICWVALLCLQSFMGIGGAKIAADNLRLQMLLPQLTIFIRFLQGMMVIIFVPLIVQSDPLVGTTAFWFTRPIGRQELLATKAWFTAGILIILALLAELFVFAANGFSLKYILLAIPEILIEKTAFIIPFFLLAVITPKFSRYAIVGISILAVYIAVIVLYAILNTFMPESASTVKSSDTEFLENYQTLALSTGVVGNIFMILFGGAIIVYQYLTRKTLRTVLYITACFLVLGAIYKFWKIDFIKTDAPTTTKTTANDIMVAINAGHISISDDVSYTKHSTRTKTFYSSVNISSPTPEEFVVSTIQAPEIQYAPDDILISSPVVDLQFRRGTKFIIPLQAAITQSKILNPYTCSGKMGEYIETLLSKINCKSRVSL